MLCVGFWVEWTGLFELAERKPQFSPSDHFRTKIWQKTSSIHARPLIDVSAGLPKAPGRRLPEQLATILQGLHYPFRSTRSSLTTVTLALEGFKVPFQEKFEQREKK